MRTTRARSGGGARVVAGKTNGTPFAPSGKAQAAVVAQGNARLAREVSFRGQRQGCRPVRCEATTIGQSDAKMHEPGCLQLATVGQEAEISAMERSIRLLEELGPGTGPSKPLQGFSLDILDEGYKRCGEITSFYAKTFYLGTQLMPPEKQQAIWAIYVWCRRTDELVDGPNASRITPEALDRWEERLVAAFEGRPYDILDAALTDTVSKFPIDIQPFKDMIDGMRMDLYKPRYETFDELYEYCYRVAGTVGLMTTPIMGVDPLYDGSLEKVYKAALALGTANQLTNILRDVGEDAKTRNRIYVPKADLASFNITEEEVLTGMFSPSSGKVDDRWRAFMKYQIERARYYFKEAEIGVGALDKDARWPVWSALILYRKILDSIENNDYNNFTTRAYVPKWRKLSSIPVALLKASANPKGL